MGDGEGNMVSRIGFIVTMLLSVVLIADAQETTKAKSPLDPDEKVYFVIHGNPFMGYYAMDRKYFGFRAFSEHHPVADVVDEWRKATKLSRDVPGATPAGQPIIPTIENIEVPAEQYGAEAFKINQQGYEALIWSSPKINLQYVKREPPMLPSLDESIIRHEAIARA